MANESPLDLADLLVEELDHVLLASHRVPLDEDPGKHVNAVRKLQRKYREARRGA